MEIGDSKFPASGTSGGSQTATSAGSSVMQRVRRRPKAEVASFATKDQETPLWNLGARWTYDVKDGVVFAKADPSKRMSYADILKRYGKKEAQTTAFVKPGIERGKGQPGGATVAGRSEQAGRVAPSTASGAQMCEVHVDPGPADGAGGAVDGGVRAWARC